MPPPTPRRPSQPGSAVVRGVAVAVPRGAGSSYRQVGGARDVDSTTAFGPAFAAELAKTTAQLTGHGQAARQRQLG